MTNIGKYPNWQLDAIEVVRQHQDGQMKYTNTEAVYKNRRWVAVTKPLTRDDWGKVFLKNMETVLLALDTKLLDKDSRGELEQLLIGISSICYSSVSAKTRKAQSDTKVFISRIATPCLSSVETPAEIIIVFGEALQAYDFCAHAAHYLIENASRLTDRDFMDSTFKTVDKEFKSTRM